LYTGHRCLNQRKVDIQQALQIHEPHLHVSWSAEL
jgi:hypothetical protein